MEVETPGHKVERKLEPISKFVPVDRVRIEIVTELAKALDLAVDREQRLAMATEAVKQMELKGWLTWPAQRRFAVKVDDPDMRKAYEYEVEAPTVMAALYGAARLAILEDAGGGMGSKDRTEDERAQMAENAGLIEGVAMYALARPIPTAN